MCILCGNPECNDEEHILGGLVDGKGNKITLPLVIIKKIMMDLKRVNFDIKSMSGKPLVLEDLPLSKIAKNALNSIVELIDRGHGDKLGGLVEEMEGEIRGTRGMSSFDSYESHNNRLETFAALYTPLEVFKIVEKYDSSNLRPDFQEGDIL